MNNLIPLAQRLHAYEPRTDKLIYQQILRLLQSIWREQQGYGSGVHHGRHGERILGSRLPMPWARETLANYLNETIRQVVREQVLDPVQSKGKLYGKPRIFNDLLSSQPLTFNLFAVASCDPDLATRWLRLMTGDDGLVVCSIDFEWSPGRGDLRYTGDRSAFDAFVRYTNGCGKNCFLGIEVKYHERMDDAPAKHRERYDELAERSGWFRRHCLVKLKNKPLQQVWRDHLLAASLLQAGDFESGSFIMLYPKINTACADIIDAYRSCLVDDSTFDAWTIDDAVVTLREAGAGSWVDVFHDRYLDIGKIKSALSTS